MKKRTMLKAAFTAVWLVALSIGLIGCARMRMPARRLVPDAMRAVHVPLFVGGDPALLERAVEEALAPAGMNTLVVEVNNRFEWQSHPELRAGNPLTREQVRSLLKVCRRNGVRLIPQYQCFGHQGHKPNILLRHYPELMAPPAPDYADPDHYHVSWNPLDPKTNEIVFDLFDELIDAFEADAFHVGMDEVMLFPDETTPYFAGETHAEVFAKAVNDYHGHLVRKRGLTMLMWGDRLIDQGQVRYNRMESSANQTAAAIGLIPRDIIICDWHYFRRESYPSIPYFQEQGFRVIPASWKSPSAALALLDCAKRHPSNRLAGFMCTTWCAPDAFCKAVMGEEVDSEVAKRAARTFFAVAEAW